jgi:predicted DNA-binding ribbon-helix-helix protein
MSQRLISRNVTINGRRTSLRLENEIWEAVTEICGHEELSVHELCTLIDGRRGPSSRTSAIRAFIVAYFRNTSTDEGHFKAGHGKLASEIGAKPRKSARFQCQSYVKRPNSQSSS